MMRGGENWKDGRIFTELRYFFIAGGGEISYFKFLVENMMQGGKIMERFSLHRGKLCESLEINSARN